MDKIIGLLIVINVAVSCICALSENYEAATYYTAISILFVDLFYEDDEDDE